MAFEYVAALVDQRFTEAAKLLDGAIAACSNGDKQALAQLLVNRGYCHQKLHLYRKALKDFESALDAYPKFPLALYRKGEVLAAQKKLEEARQVWNGALQACSEATDAHLVLDISAALRDPSSVKVTPGPPTSRSAQQQHGGGGRAVLLLQVLTVLMLGLVLAGQYQVSQQAGLRSIVGPATATPDLASASAANRTAAAVTSPNGWASQQAPAAAVVAPATPMQQPAAPPAAAAASSPTPPAAAPKPSPSAGPAAAAPPPTAERSAPAASTSSSSQPPVSAAVPKQPPAAAAAAPPAGRSAAGPASSSGRGPSPAPATAAAVAIAAAAAIASGGGTCDVEEVDCVAKQAAAAARGGRGAAGADAALSNAMAIQMAVTQINAGQLAEAVSILDRVLVATPRELGARVARGTARALRRDLAGAVEDFSVAIEVEPRYPDSWKRRGQARSALGDSEGALADLQKAIDLAPLFGGADTASSRAECWVEKGMIHQKLRDYRRACAALRTAVKLDPANAQAWNVLGLCSTSQGDIRDGVKAYEKAVELSPRLKEAWVNMGQALKEEGRTKEAEKALKSALALDPPDAPSVHVLRVLAQMRQQQGEHAEAVRIVDRALPLALAKDEQVIELLYLRAICHHAMGAVREAVRDYDDCLGYIPKAGLANATEETRQFQFLSFYQKDMALYTHHALERRAADFCPDSEIPALFKELWCKKGPPTAELVAQYPPQPPLPLSPPPLPPGPDPARLRQLTVAADALGVLLQNYHQGFLPNLRQQRAAGYAAIELGQALAAAVAARRAGRQHWVRSEGSSGQAGAAGRHLWGWRDAMDIVVKWRQLAEPNDQVVWVDLLTRREFEQGFGSHTPMFSGQTKCVRYYMNFARALELQKQVLLREGHAFDASNRPIPCGSADQQEAIRAARTAEDMYGVIQQDSWVVVPIASVASPGSQLEGTRLTLVRVPGQPDAFEFSIRTPVTPPRWRDFDAELEAGFEAILNAFVEGDAAALAPRIMAYCYYWYNFMPLARGTAAVGYTTMLALFWAAGMPVTAPIPKDYQVDWEAILSQHPDDFAAAVGSWLYPAQARPALADGSAAGIAGADGSSSKAAAFPPVETLPPVADVLGTIRNRLIALNGEGMKRVV